MRHDPADVERASKLFKALAHPARLELACRLADSPPKTQKQLIDELGWPQSSMARHLAPLRELGLVESERDGVEVRLTVRDTIIKTLFQSVCDWLADDTTNTSRTRKKNGAPRVGETA
jgi:DNA-binding transcriptional ArsR family regulator